MVSVTAAPPLVGGPSVVTPVLPVVSAFPDPITLPVSPKGDPDAVRALATGYSELANDLDRVARQVDGIVVDLAARWRGHGATALQVPASVIAADLRTLAAGARSAAEHLEDYAEALHKAQHHHGWSLTKIIAVGAIVAVTTVAVVVTVGAAAPVGTLAAVEVGEAIAGAEAAAGAATAAETAATTALSLTGQTMTGLRGLTMALLPHLTNGAISTGIDTGIHLATGHTDHRHRARRSLRRRVRRLRHHHRHPHRPAQHPSLPTRLNSRQSRPGHHRAHRHPRRRRHAEPVRHHRAPQPHPTHRKRPPHRPHGRRRHPPQPSWRGH